MVADLCVCGHLLSKHDDGTEPKSDLAALTSDPIKGDIFKSAPRGETRCNVSGCACLSSRPAGPQL
jgi:hypothetical protein